MSGENDNIEQVPLLERVEMPEIPKEATRDIALLEKQFVDAEVTAMRQAIPIMRPLFTQRNALITSKLQQADFWPRVFANAPGDVDRYVLPSDAEIIGRCLKNLTVERSGVNEKGEGEPRSVRFVFEFEKGGENEWFEGGEVVKEFQWRKTVWKSQSGRRNVWEGLVSEPVRIQWKEGRDPTRGLLGAACDLADAEKEVLKKEGKSKLTAQERIALPAYEKLVKKVAKMEEEVEGNEGEGDDEEGESSPVGLSFFAWFGYRGRDISAEESEAANKEDAERWEKIAKGEKVEGDNEDEESDDEDEEDDDGLIVAEAFPDGEELAVALGEDLWPNALKYYVQSYDVMDDSDFDDIDMEDLEDDESEDDDEGAGDEDEAERPRKKVRT